MLRSAITALALCATTALPAQTHEHPSPAVPGSTSNVENLLQSAREATAHYRDRNVAIAAGYRRVGRDFPSMGEHWLNPKLIVEGKLDVTRPQILTYVKVDGRPVLTGVVYAIPLEQGESPPDIFGIDARWHEHNGSVDEEGLLPEHHSAPSANTGTRVAFLHAWVHVRGSEGTFDAENWAIPFIRLELPVPDRFPNGASRALSLLTGGDDFFKELIGPGALLSVASFSQCAKVAAEITGTAKRANRPLSREQLERLDAAWQQLLAQVERESGIEAAKRINGGVASSH